MGANTSLDGRGLLDVFECRWLLERWSFGLGLEQCFFAAAVVLSLADGGCLKRRDPCPSQYVRYVISRGIYSFVWTRLFSRTYRSGRGVWGFVPPSVLRGFLLRKMS